MATGSNPRRGYPSSEPHQGHDFAISPRVFARVLLFRPVLFNQHRQHRSRPHRLLQGQQERLLALFIETEVHDCGRAQTHPRPQRRCAGSCSRVGRYGSLPAVASRAQEGRDAICAHETDSQTRPISATWPERRQGRGPAHSNRAEPEAARQASLPCPTTFGRGLPWVGVAASVDGVNKQRSSHNGERDQRTARAQNQTPQSIPEEFCNRIGGAADLSQTSHHVRYVPASEVRPVATHKKAPDDAGAFETLKISRDQYFATTGPVQLKR
jgi:hypothetical protein